MSDTPLRCEVFWANLEPVMGSEQGGSRPVLIISNNLMNESASVVIAIPMTRSGEKPRSAPYNIFYKSSQILIIENAVEELKKMGYLYAHDADGMFLCNQSRTITKARLIYRLGSIADKDLIQRIEEAIKHSYALEACNICGVPLRTDGLICVRCGRVYRRVCSCGTVFKIEFKYCPACGRGINDESSKQTRLN